MSATKIRTMKRPHVWPIGTQVQEPSGRVRVKTSLKVWTPRGRHNMQKKIRRELKENERVYHMSTDKADDNLNNLVIIAFRTVKYRLEHSRAIFVPKNLSRN